MYAVLIALAAFLSGGDAAPLVVDDVDLIAVAHLPGDEILVFFFSRVQNSWTCIDHRWACLEMNPRISADGFEISWLDESESPHCYRLVRAPAYVESWEPESPLAQNHNKPWFVRLVEPGLKQPPKPQPQGEQ